MMLNNQSDRQNIAQSSTELPKKRLRSFVRRNGRRTEAQDAAKAALWPEYGLSLEDGQLDLPALFHRNAPIALEIGFGSGQSLLAAAKQFHQFDFIGVEAHKPGIGALLLGVQQEQLQNIRVFDADAVLVLEQCLADNSLSQVSIFFPDPWQKRRHHKRRLIQPAFLDLLLKKMKPGAALHLATDWAHYAQHMMEVLSNEKRLINLAGEGCYAERSPFRPVLTKFERRAVKDGREIRDLQFACQK